MGKATRWLKGLLGMKKEKEKEKEKFDNSSYRSKDNRDKKRWSFAKLGKDSDSVGDVPAIIEASISASHTAWLRSYIADTEEEQKKHAIAVATATAAAADAAVAAAQAAVAVVRLTNQGRVSPLLAEVRERLAAVKIQTIFRGFLARKALRALKALVKLQALVRGYLIRKQTTATFYSMQALIRAQTAIRTQRARRSISKENRQYYPENRPRKSIEKIDETRSESHSKRLSTACQEVPLNVLDESPKIVEIDTYMTGSRSSRISNSSTVSEYGEDQSSQAMSSPLLCSIPGRLSVPDSKHYQDHDRWYYFNGDECKFPTAQSTPRFANFVRPYSPSTPAKSVCGDSFFRPYFNVPSYMANTQSFRAKLRSRSAPKQRPELGPKKVYLNEVMAARNSLSSVRMHRPSIQTCSEDSCNF